jgi:hypothetical protein
LTTVTVQSSEKVTGSFIAFGGTGVAVGVGVRLGVGVAAACFSSATCVRSSATSVLSAATSVSSAWRVAVAEASTVSAAVAGTPLQTRLAAMIAATVMSSTPISDEVGDPVLWARIDCLSVLKHDGLII